MMGVMKEFDRRIRGGGDDAIAAVSELWEVREKTLFDMTDAFTRARWIPVAERRPKPGVDVLIFLRPIDEKFSRVCVASMDRINGHCLWTSEYGDEMPSHWMPLPAPPTDDK